MMKNSQKPAKQVQFPTSTQLEDYLDKRSDFGFELKVLQQLTNMKFKCEHSGPYIDPVTSKSREFDIVARMERGNRYVHLAVEVKNLHLPLVVFRRNRTEMESYNEVISMAEPNAFQVPQIVKRRSNVEKGHYTVRIGDNFSIYGSREFTGKKVEQYKLKKNNGNGADSIESSGKDAYEKISQVVSSAEALVREVFSGKFKTMQYHAILPIVVVPDGMLSIVDYDASGTRSTPITNASTASVSIDHICSVQPNERSYLISHYEVTTFSGLKDRLKAVLNEAQTFPDCPLFRGVGSSDGSWVV